MMVDRKWAVALFLGSLALITATSAALAGGLGNLAGIPLNAGTITALVYALLALAWAVIRLTPTDQDDRVLEAIEKIIKLILPGILPSLVPDRKKKDQP